MNKKRSNDEELTECLKELHLPAVRGGYQELADAARRETLSYEAYLLEVVQRECQLRRQHRMERLLRESRLPVDKSLAAFDLKRLPGKVSAMVRTLLDGSFVERKENVLVFGTPGAGKSHLLCAIGQELVRCGKTVYFSSTNLLVQELLLAKRELRLPKAIKKLARYAALVLDDLGCRTTVYRSTKTPFRRRLSTSASRLANLPMSRRRADAS